MNMPETFPNQRMITVHRETLIGDFLGIKNENWQAARFKTLLIFSR